MMDTRLVSSGYLLLGLFSSHFESGWQSPTAGRDRPIAYNIRRKRTVLKKCQINGLIIIIISNMLIDVIGRMRTPFCKIVPVLREPRRRSSSYICLTCCPDSPASVVQYDASASEWHDSAMMMDSEWFRLVLHIFRYFLRTREYFLLLYSWYSIWKSWFPDGARRNGRM